MLEQEEEMRFSERPNETWCRGQLVRSSFDLLRISDDVGSKFNLPLDALVGLGLDHRIEKKGRCIRLHYRQTVVDQCCGRRRGVGVGTQA